LSSQFSAINVAPLKSKTRAKQFTPKPLALAPVALAGFALVSEPQTLAIDDDDARVVQVRREGWWLPFLDTYRTMCFAPSPEFRRVLEEIRALYPLIRPNLLDSDAAGSSFPWRLSTPVES
jgi:hypothetical protein